MKINSSMHSAIDYGVVLFLFASPTVFLLPPLTCALIYSLGILHLLLTLFTDFQGGAMRIIPFCIHGWIELTVSLVLVGIGFYLGKLEGDLAKFYCFSLAIAVFVVWAITDYKTQPPKKRLYQ